MLLKDIQTIFHKELDAEYGNHEVANFFNILIKHFLDLDRISLVLEPQLTILKKEEEPLFDALSRLKNHEPIQYIIGETEFFGLNFKVNQHTLIPRPETEELVEWIIDNVTSSLVENSLDILDIGTGTGCIAITLAKKLPNAQVTAIDISEGALQIAKQNALDNKVEITFIKADILKKDDIDSKNRKFDIIVSNPPYVRYLEKVEMKPNVLDYEPSQALFVADDNPLQFYKAITEFAVDNLKENGLLFFEINQYLGQETKQLLADYGFKNCQLKQDIFGNDRMLIASK
ncbi:peptide chain release factor N(5)-glutamine methyltransferase [Hanstruepera neustonica]|uniref:Release factor glutamine methyltransferase n=1 Tax=Hanstruepera neustonica TaxID=1445657 RepID=A0A2K1DXD1_9FLAO|nr:peptide chain release factor N(5)-glutamine methyltransferase [Hanstruepera neustonica]PNQ72694.1 peptide chain release factor N(5)-glutamine methyltransferase [Hanstruepera neustonica]